MIRNVRLGSVGLAIVCALALVVWMATGLVSSARVDNENTWKDPEPRIPRVQVEQLAATVYQPEVVVQGQVEPWKTVQIRAQVAGTVESLPVRLGQAVKGGDVLLGLSDDARMAELEQTRAELARAEADLRATTRLRGADLTSELELLRLESEVARVRAEHARAERAVNNRQPVAPFPAVLDHRSVDLGDFVQPGEPLVQLVDVSRLKVTARVSQQKVGDLVEGQEVMVELLNGHRLKGELTFIAHAADPETRSFRIEAAVDNPERRRIAGGSATLRIGLEPMMATPISPAYLNLGTDGRLAVKHVSKDDRVQLTPVRMISADSHGAWIDGLPLEARVITRGAGFVSVGDRVEPVMVGTGEQE